MNVDRNEHRLRQHVNTNIESGGQGLLDGTHSFLANEPFKRILLSPQAHEILVLLAGHVVHHEVHTQR